MAVLSYNISVPSIMSEQVEGHERYGTHAFSTARSCGPIQMSKVIIVENATILVELVIHKIPHTDVIVLYAADPKVMVA
jgi:hypothetical protein